MDSLEYMLEDAYSVSLRNAGSPEQADLKARLKDTGKLVKEVKDFGKLRLDFYTTPNYQVYRDDSEARLLHSLTLRHPDHEGGKLLERIGVDKQCTELFDRPVELQSFVSDLEETENFYKDAGYSTFRRKVYDFSDSTGCNLNSDFLDNSLVRKVELVLHEDFHYNMRVRNQGFSGDIYISESAASVVGLAGAVEFCAQAYGWDSTELYAAKRKLKSHRSKALASIDLYNLGDKIRKMDKSLKRKIYSKGRSLLMLLVHDYANDARFEADMPYYMHFNKILQIYKKSDIRNLVETLYNCPTGPESVEYLDSNLAKLKR